MKRLCGIFAMVAAVLAIAVPASAVPELGLSLGNGIVDWDGSGSPWTPSVGANPSVDVNVALGESTVTFPIYLSVRRGDTTPAVLNVSAWGLQISSLGTGSGLAAFMGGANFGAPPYQQLGIGPAGSGPNIHWPGSTNLAQMQAGSSPPGSLGYTSGGYGGSGGPSDATDVDGAPMYLLGFMTFQVGGDAGDVISLRMHTRTATTTSAPFLGNAQPLHLALGYHPVSGGLDTDRLFNGAISGEPIGGAINQITNWDDAVINIIPEPGTLALLALGALGLRRRRA